MKAINDLYNVILDRRKNKLEGSYTCYLFEQGIDKILKKVGEECAETIIAAKNGGKKEITEEICDLIYHLMVMLAELDIPIDDIENLLEQRAQKIGNLKQIKNVDRNT